MKYLKFIIIFVIVIIILLVVLILNVGKSSNENIAQDNYINNKIVNANTVSNVINNNISLNNNVPNGVVRDGEVVDGTIKHLNNYNMFFTVESAIQSYINITSPNTKFRAIDMNYVSGYSLNQYGVYGNLLESNGSVKDAYFIVNMNQGNLRYTIKEQENITDLSSIRLNIPSENEITQNSYQVKFVNATDDVIVKKILDDYINLEVNYPETAYKMLDKSYRMLRFTDYADYLNYVRNNLSKFQNIEIVSYSNNTNKTEFIIRDNFGNVYDVKLTGLMNYTIILDDYTIIDASYYNTLSDEEKVKFNVNKIIKMINTCDYTNLYYRLNDTFKANNFSLQSEFENYLKMNYYSYNIVDNINLSVDESGVYICLVLLKNESKLSANTVTKTIIMKLDNETNFEFSFGV